GLALDGAGLLELETLGLGPGHRLARGVGFVPLGLAGRADRGLAFLADVLESGAGGNERCFDLRQRRQAGKLVLDLALLVSDVVAARSETAQAFLQLGD